MVYNVLMQVFFSALAFETADRNETHNSQRFTHATINPKRSKEHNVAVLQS
jgi:hypothetical protein